MSCLIWTWFLWTTSWCSIPKLTEEHWECLYSPWLGFLCVTGFLLQELKVQQHRIYFTKVGTSYLNLTCFLWTTKLMLNPNSNCRSLGMAWIGTGDKFFTIRFIGATTKKHILPLITFWHGFCGKQSWCSNPKAAEGHWECLYSQWYVFVWMIAFYSKN